MNVLLAGCAQLFLTHGWFERLGILYRDTGNAMVQADVEILGAQLNIKQLQEYRIATGRRTSE